MMQAQPLDLTCWTRNGRRLIIPVVPGSGWRWLLIRRHRRTGELAFYRCYAPQPVTLAALVLSDARHERAGVGRRHWGWAGLG